MSEHTSHFAKVLEGLLDDALRREVIGGVSVADVLESLATGRGPKI